MTHGDGSAGNTGADGDTHDDHEQLLAYAFGEEVTPESVQSLAQSLAESESLISYTVGLMAEVWALQALANSERLKPAQCIDRLNTLLDDALVIRAMATSDIVENQASPHALPVGDED